MKGTQQTPLCLHGNSEAEAKQLLRLARQEAALTAITLSYHLLKYQKEVKHFSSNRLEFQPVQLLYSDAMAALEKDNAQACTHMGNNVAAYSSWCSDIYFR